MRGVQQTAFVIGVPWRIINYRDAAPAGIAPWV